MEGNSRALPAGRQGYIAVTSALLIAFLVTIVTAALSLTVYMSRFNALGAEAKEQSFALAEACADTALLKLAQNPSYAGNETVTVAAPDACKILPVETVGAQKVVKTTGTFQGAVTTIKVTVTTGVKVTIVSWEEIP